MADNNEKHKIVIVGGGASGLELATNLGSKLGKKGLAEVMLAGCRIDPYLEAAAARSSRRYAGRNGAGRISGPGLSQSFPLPARQNGRLKPKEKRNLCQPNPQR